MKKDYFFLALVVLLIGSTTSASAQVSNDNEDEVYKIDQHFAKDFVPGQVLVKMKDGNPATVRRTKGRFQSAGIAQLDKVLTKFGVEDMEQLLPNAKVGKTPRRAKAYNGETIVERDLTQLYKLTLAEDKAPQTLQLIDELNTLDEVEFAEPNYIMYIMDSHIADTYDTNPLTTQQWYLDAYGVKELWNKPIIHDKRPVIAIIDSGVDLTHPDLVDNLWTNAAEANGEEGYDNDGNGFKNDVHGWDFVNNTGNVRDNNMHGTHVAGIAAAANNGTGIIGANPQALIMAVSVMQSDGQGDVATIVKGIDYAVANGADVLNLSLGGYVNSRAMRQALEKAYQTAVIVAAAGNDFKRIDAKPNCHPGVCDCAVTFPAGYSFVLGVQATTQGGSLAGFSNHDMTGPNFSSTSTLQDPDGFNYELKAPGTNMLSTIPGGKYKVLQGTSMASPLVAGAISALKMVKNYDTQEILWGDLLHSDNIAEAYAVTNRPAELDMLNIQMRNRKELDNETEEDYSGDHELDAGETVNIYPVIRTTFGEASNIMLHLEVGEYEDPDAVQIQTDADHKVSFGMHLDAYGKGVSLNPLVLTVPNNIADARHVKLKVVATCDESNESFEWDFTIVVTNMVKISGLISEDRTLTADHVYLVNENLAIMEGATLTIEPGTRLEFAEGMGLSSSGKLVANGTPEKPIVFTGHNDAIWAGIKSHETTGKQSHDAILYTNDAQTLFTLLPTETTPNEFTGKSKTMYTDDIYSSVYYFYLQNYIEDFSNDFTARQDLLTDPNYLTSAVLQMLNDWDAYCSQYSTQRSSDKFYPINVHALPFSWISYDNPRDVISYCRLDGFTSFENFKGIYHPYMKDCILDCSAFSHYLLFADLNGERITIENANSGYYAIGTGLVNIKNANFVNNFFGNSLDYIPKYSMITDCNYFNSYMICRTSGKYYDKQYLLGIASNLAVNDRSNNPSYLGTSREDIIRPYIYEIGNAPNTYGAIDLTNMRTTPIAEAHGIVWKVVVNGKDAQDEYEDLAPLGVGKHKFEVYFNRPMNKNVAPQIAFGVREPYTQNAVAEDGSWNEEGTIYTAYKTIDGKTKSDGVNRIYVWGAEDDEYFEIPYEKTRFNVMINAAGSMATGFAAEAGLGRVNLTWDNTNNNFDDAMGFNIYRYGEEYEKILPAGYYNGITPTSSGNGTYYAERTITVADTVRLNTEILDIETVAYTDYDVTPGETYYYYYKVLSTDLQEYDVSNVVVCTPQTSSLGDANGDTHVDVTDVMTTVNYALGMDQKPFIFAAADVNTDNLINVLDVIGIVQMVLNPSSNNARAYVTEAEPEIVYTVKDGMLFLDTPVEIGGFQVQLSLSEELRVKSEEFTPTEVMKGFEVASSWLTKNDYRMMAYSFGNKTLPAGKHAVLYIGNADITSLCISDAIGNKLDVKSDDPTSVEGVTGLNIIRSNGVFNLQGQKVSREDDFYNLQRGVYIINGKKVVK